MSWLLWWRPPCLLRLVIVNLKDEQESAIKGVLWKSRGPWLVVRNATALQSGVQPAQVDGEVLIHRSNVQFIQILPDGHS